MKSVQFRWLLLGHLWLLSFALPADAFDLLQAVESAREYNAEFSAAQEDLNASREKATQGRALLMTQVNASANYQYSNQVAPGQLGHHDSITYGIHLQQPLFDVRKYTEYQKSQLTTQQAEIFFTAAQQQLIMDTSQAYFNVLLAHHTLAATRASKKTSHQQLEHTKAAFEGGSATMVDINETQANHDGAVAQEIQAYNSLALAESHFRRLTGLDPKNIRPLRDKLRLDQTQPATLDGWLELALRNSPNIRAEEKALEIADTNLTQAQGAHMPTINLTASYNNTQSRAPIQQLQTRSSIGSSLTLPLFAGGGITSQVREATARKESAKKKLEASRRQVSEDVRRAFLSVATGVALVRAQERLLTSATSRVESIRFGKKMGIRNNIDLLQAEQTYYSTRVSLARANYDYLIARLSLSKASGQLDSQALSEVNTLICR